MEENILTSANTIILKSNITEHWFKSNEKCWVRLLNSDDFQRYNKINSQRKKLQLLLGRTLIHYAYATLNKASIATYKIENYSQLLVSGYRTPCRLSIAHSGDYVMVVLTNCELNIGIDIEQKLDRDFKGLSKEYFNSKEEQVLIENNFSPITFYQLWTAKESLTKAISGKLFDIMPVDLSSVINNEQSTFAFKDKNFNCCHWEFDTFICALVCDQPIQNFNELYFQV